MTDLVPVVDKQVHAPVQRAPFALDQIVDELFLPVQRDGPLCAHVQPVVDARPSCPCTQQSRHLESCTARPGSPCLANYVRTAYTTQQARRTHLPGRISPSFTDSTTSCSAGLAAAAPSALLLLSCTYTCHHEGTQKPAYHSIGLLLPRISSLAVSCPLTR